MRRGMKGVDRADQRGQNRRDQHVTTSQSGSDYRPSVTALFDAQDALPDWLDRIAFLDSNYNFEARHGDKLLAWLGASARHRLVVLAYDDREIMLDGRKVVSDSGGTWRATERMIRRLSVSVTFTHDTLGAFLRARSAQIELLRHPNPANRILHTEMIGEMNGYMHAMLSGRPGYGDAMSVLKPAREYMRFVESPPLLPSSDIRTRFPL